MKEFGIVSLVFRSDAGRTALRVFDGGAVTIGAKDESAERVGGDGGTGFAAGAELAGLGAGVGADKCVEPTMADFSGGTLEAISAREFAVGVGWGVVSCGVSNESEVASDGLERGRESGWAGKSLGTVALWFGSSTGNGTGRLNVERSCEFVSGELTV